MLQKLKMPIIIIAVLFVGFFVVTKFVKKDETKETITTTKVTPTSPDKNIVPLLLKIKDITFDGSIFSNPIFSSLKDFSKEIVKEEIGRPNPFAPSSSTSAATSTLTGLNFDFRSPATPGAISAPRF